MTDDFSKDEESFADLLDAYGSDMGEDLKSGDKVNGRIIHIGADSIFVDTGTKIDGVVEKKELLDEDGLCPLAVGDTIDLYVVSAGESEIILSKAISGKADAGIIINAMETKTPVEGRVKEVCKGGFHVEILGKQAFCPVSQMDVRYIEDPEPYAGQTFKFLVTRVEGDGRNIVISRREYLNIDIEKARDAFFKSSPVGKVVEGQVTKVMPYGAFVELVPGVEGMVHISELGWSRVDDPEEVVKAGDGVQVRVLSIEEGKKAGTHKISLSMKQAGDDPWALVKDSFHVGDTVTGKVRRLVNFGAFIEISPGIEGLVHISEMSYTRRVLRPDELISEGETIEVMVKEIDPESKRISLSMRDATGDPWADIESRFKVGQKVKGELSGKESFGYFVNLEPGVTALLPKSRINKADNPSKIEGVKVGGTIELFIEEINPGDRKITLTAKGADDGGDWKSYSSRDEGSMGSLGDLLQQALNSGRDNK